MKLAMAVSMIYLTAIIDVGEYYFSLYIFLNDFDLKNINLMFV